MSQIINCIPGAAGQFNNLLAQSILTLGQPSFGAALLGAVAPAVGADLLSAFSIDEVGRPRYRFATAVTELGDVFAQRAGARYESDHWSSDPGLSRLIQAQKDLRGTVVCQQASNEIRHAWYRAVCYEQPRLIDRISLIGAVDGRRLLFSAYRRAVHGPFTADEIGQFAARADALVALVSKHVALTQETAQPPSAPALDAHLASRFPVLSTRERQICAGIVRGLSAKDIAKTCGIEPSSVVTYKKRALDKLGLPNQRALVVLWHVVGPGPGAA